MHKQGYHVETGASETKFLRCTAHRIPDYVRSAPGSSEQKRKERKQGHFAGLCRVVSCATMTFADVALVTEREGDAYIPT
jgi:hypothetical protein